MQIRRSSLQQQRQSRHVHWPCRWPVSFVSMEDSPAGGETFPGNDEQPETTGSEAGFCRKAGAARQLHEAYSEYISKKVNKICLPFLFFLISPRIVKLDGCNNQPGRLFQKNARHGSSCLREQKKRNSAAAALQRKKRSLRTNEHIKTP